MKINAARALGKLKDPRAAGPLVGALGDIGSIQDAAAEALVQIGDPAVEPLIEAMTPGRSGSVTRKWATKALGRLRNPRALEVLVRALKDQSRRVRDEAAGALAKFGSQAVEPLIAELADPRQEFRMRAVAALIKLGEPAIEPLIGALKSDDYVIASCAAKALGEIADPRAVDPLTARLSHPNELLRKNAAEALKRITRAVPKSN